MRRRRRVILLTGFERFGPHLANPTADIVKALHAKRVAGVPIVGRVLPVSLDRLSASLDATLAGIDPVAVVALGLAGGEAVIRLERVAINLADFRAPDNDGTTATGRKLAKDGPDALFSRLDTRACLARLLDAGIPARLSESAGTYLCNAAMYELLRRVDPAIACGFVHLPDTPKAVAARLKAGTMAGESTASMALETMIRAISLVLEASLARPAASRR